MDMLGHHHVTGNIKAVQVASPLQCLLEHLTCMRRIQKSSALMTTEGDEMKMSSLVVPPKTPRHDQRIRNETRKNL
jgi:hypothetical protein